MSCTALLCALIGLPALAHAAPAEPTGSAGRNYDGPLDVLAPADAKEPEVVQPMRGDPPSKEATTPPSDPPSETEPLKDEEIELAEDGPSNVPVTFFSVCAVARQYLPGTGDSILISPLASVVRFSLFPLGAQMETRLFANGLPL